MTEACIICGSPVDYEGDPYCRPCGMGSELESQAIASQRKVAEAAILAVQAEVSRG
jgi:hypothetical protein